MAEFGANNDPVCDDDDMFDSVVMAEERCQEEGYQKGFEKGKTVGLEQGYQMGREKGEQVGDEMGFYLGFAVTWRGLLKDRQETEPSRTRPVKALESLIGALDTLPQDEPNSLKYWDTVHKIRAKFKQVASLLNISVKYTPKSEPHQGLSF